jgi:hypothetical protein
MTDYPRYIHRTLKASPSEYEQTLSRVLFDALSRRIHDLPGIIEALNASPVRAADGGAWSEASLVAELERLGAYPNSIGAPLGKHPVGIVPRGSSTPERPQSKRGGGPAHAE